MNNYLEDEYPEALIKDLKWTRQYHKQRVRDIEDKLMELSKKYQKTISLDD